jgi:hypothetical protein
VRITYWIALTSLAVLGLGTAAAQQLRERTIKEQLVGTWRVLAAVNEVDDRKAELFGPNPKGQFIFTRDGHFATNIIRYGRSKFTSNSRMTGTPEENKEAVVGKHLHIRGLHGQFGWINNP